MSQQEGTYDSAAAKVATLDRILAIFGDLGATQIFVKRLAPNDNSKNQPYFGPHLTDLAFIPTGRIAPSESTSKRTSDPKRRIKYQASLKLSWIDAEGQTYNAPKAKLIYYPQYPEVRFSGFLQGSRVKAGEWMDPKKQGRSKGRWLILGVHPDETVYAYLGTPGCHLSSELERTKFIKVSSIFGEIDPGHTMADKPTRESLTTKLLEIHRMGWIPGQKLNSDLTSTAYKAQNGGGYTLEAKLGIPPNGYSEPDYLGWEVKQFGVTRFPKTGAKPTTLMTPEPDGGLYQDQGVPAFVRLFGYPDTSGIEDRLNFGGKHTYGHMQYRTGLKLDLLGFDVESRSITDATGSIVLADSTEKVVASWSFAKVMSHWKRKHAQAVYVPCLRRNSPSGSGGYEYQYGNSLEFGMGTDFEKFLTSIADGHVYYDPGIKLEYASTTSPKLKRRSQFRINHRFLDSLYRRFVVIDILDVEN